MLILSLLGPVRAELEGQSLLPLPTSKAQALLTYLTVENTLSQSLAARRETLVELLWPGMPEQSARQNLRQTLYLLRQDLPVVPGKDGAPVSFLLSDRQTVQINPEAICETDVAEFQQLVADGSLAALEKAVSLYRGDFLSDFYLDDSNEFEAWAASHRARFRRQMLAALQSLAAHYLAAADYAQAEQYARRQLELDELREQAQRQLLEALARSGRRSAALAAYEAFRAVLATELAVEPAVETQALYATIQDETWHSVPARQSQPSPLMPYVDAPAKASLPHLLTPFFGREEELAQVKSWLQGDSNRLVTLVGPGGSGKTRLALEAGRSLQEAFDHGVHFVSLTEIDSLYLFETAVAGALGVSLHLSSSPTQQVTHFLQEKELLLILDNVEHVLISAGLVAEWLKVAPGFRILATSRERLGVYGESLLRVDGLDTPSEAKADVKRFSAVALFLNRAQRVDPDFELTLQNQTDITRICRLLQGIPLAIELAAPWTRLLSCDSIADEISRNLDLLSGSQQDLPPRHRSLRALFDYTWLRLAPDEQVLLQQLAVFRGSMSVDAACQVAEITLPTLAGLVDKSLLSEVANDRFEMHLPLRQYAREHTQYEPEKVAAAAYRHAVYYAAYIHKRTGSLEGGRVLPMVQEITREIDNVRAAWKWAVASQDRELMLQMVIPLLLFYEIRGWYSEGAKRFEAASATSAGNEDSDGDDTSLLVRAYLLAAHGWFAHRLGHYPLTQRVLNESLQLAGGLAEKRLQAFVLSTLALVDSRLGDSRRAERYAAESLAIAETLEDPFSKAFSLLNIAYTALFHGHYERAQTVYEEALAAFRRFNNDYGAAICLGNLGHISMRLGKYDAALQVCQRAKALCEGVGHQFGLSNTLRRLAETWLAKGNHVEAERYAAQSLKLAEAIGDREGYAWAALSLGEVATAQGNTRAAERLFLHSNEIFVEFNHTLGLAETTAQLGALALADGDYRQAVTELQHSLSYYKRVGHNDGTAVVQALLGEAHRQQGTFTEAVAHFLLALTIGRDIELPPVKAAILYRSAHLFLPEHPLSAATCFQVVATHPAAEHQIRTGARERLEELSATLPALHEPQPAGSKGNLDAYLEKLHRRLQEYAL